MNIRRKHSGIFILVVFLTAQLGEPMHYLWTNHVRFKASAPGNEIKAPVVTHICSQFNLLKNRLFLPPAPWETNVLTANGAKVVLPSFFFQHIVKEVQRKHSVRGPPPVIIFNALNV